MIFTYQHCEQEFAKRRKGSNSKAVLRNCTLTKQGDDFIITMTEWRNQKSTLAIVRPDNVITLMYDKRIDMTVCNRLQAVCGLWVRLNKRRFGAYKQPVRVHKYNTWSDSMPYFVGMQIDVNSKPFVINPQPDVRTIVDRSAINLAKKEFEQIRKLSKVMLRMNAFDDLFSANVYARLDGTKFKGVKPLSQVNAQEPTMDDVMAVVAAGKDVAMVPDSYVYDPNIRQYTHRPVAEVRRRYLESCVENGLRLLRRQFYEASNAYVQEKLAA